MLKMITRIILISNVILITILLSHCHKEDKLVKNRATAQYKKAVKIKVEKNGTKKKENKKIISNKQDLTFVMVPKGIHPYYDPCYEGFKDAGIKYGIKTKMVSPPKFELALQVKVLEDLIAQKVDGIAISALDDIGLVSVVDEAVDAGIKVITFDAPALSTKSLTYIGTNNKKAGYEAGLRMAELMGKTGQVAILQGGFEASNLNLRKQGFMEAIKKSAPDINIVSVQDIKGDYAIAVNKIEELLENYPNLKGIFGVSSYGAPAAAIVAKEHNKQGQLIICGFDDLKDTLSGIKDGSIQFCIVQKTYKMGWLSVEKLIAAVNEEEITKVIDTGVIFVTKNNVQSYMNKMKKELHN